MDPMSALIPIAEAGTVLAAAALALALRPWRCVGRTGPPWPWIAAWAALPLLWGLGPAGAASALQPMSGAALLVLLAGWPLTVIALLPVAAIGVLTGPLDWIDGLHRLVWLGLVPATVMLAAGWAVRRWLPHRLLAYVIGRAYVGTLLACVLAASVALAFEAPPPGTARADLVLARALIAVAEAFVTGTLVLILCACRPAWLATYSERLYRPPVPPQLPRRAARTRRQRRRGAGAA
jgi:uncharacterized membrane protein